MKAFYKYSVVVLLVILFGCQSQKSSFTDTEKDTIKKEVKDQFNLLVSAINKIDTKAWSENYSKDEFISAFVSTDLYSKRSEWIDTVAKYFTMRKSQKVEPIEVIVSPLTPDLALMTSEEKSIAQLKDGNSVSSNHVFTMLWKKEKEGWKILHSHESWVDEVENKK